MFVVIAKSPFWKKERIQRFDRFSIVFCSYSAFPNRRSMTSNFLIFHASKEISSGFAVFLVLIFSSINCPSLMSFLLLIIFSWFMWDFRKVPARFLKCSFHLWSLSSWLADFSFSLEVFCFRRFHLLSPMLTVIVYLRLNFWIN